jgi:HD-GYP domain-containing protein (c-di-GMP phosphodiesterase class II)
MEGLDNYKGKLSLDERDSHASIIASIKDGICIFDLKLAILMANPTMEQWYPHALPLVGKKCYQAYFGFSEPCRPCPAQRAIITKKPQVETIARRGVGGEFLGWMEVHSFAWLNRSDGKVKGVINYIRDITTQWRTEEGIANTMRNLQDTLNGTLVAIANIQNRKSPFTTGHQVLVAQIACGIAKQMQLPQNMVDGFRVMGFIHDIGKLFIPAEILHKTSQLSEYEFTIVKAHPQIGYDIIKKIEFPWAVAQAVQQHHERLDGSGYPLGLSRKDIILEARILAVADVVEAMSSPRPYRPALGLSEAMNEIRQNQDILYDRKVVNVCENLFNEKKFIFK